MLTFLDWQSDGITARLALMLYGLILLAIVLHQFRHNYSAIGRLLPAALLWHLIIGVFIAFWMLPHYASTGAADNYGYHHNGIRIARFIRAGDLESIPWHFGTDAMPIVTGLLYAPFGADVYGMLFVAAVLGLTAGLYLCRAFSLWGTPEQVRKYAAVVLFLPSFVTWTSTFGKDSWIALGLGLTAYGYSVMLKHGHSTGLGYLTIGNTIVTIIRPHIAVMVVASMTLAYLWSMLRAPRGSGLKRYVTIIILIGILSLLASFAQDFLWMSEVSAGGMQEYARLKGGTNALGGSAVEVQAAPGITGALLAFPRGVVRVLFQPFPWEIHNLYAGMAAVENIFILWFACSHAKRLRALFRGIGREPFVLFSSLLACALLLMFSFIPNLGLLSRQRVQLLPFLFVPLVTADVARRRRPGFGRSPAEGSRRTVTMLRPRCSQVKCWGRLPEASQDNQTCSHDYRRE
jgi:hypothetical protein